MIQITARSGSIDPGEVTYQYQEEPTPGGLLFTVTVSGTERDNIHHLCRHILSGGEDQIPVLLASIIDVYDSWEQKRYVLNTICTIDMGEDDILLEAIGSPL